MSLSAIHLRSPCFLNCCHLSRLFNPCISETEWSSDPRRIIHVDHTQCMIRRQWRRVAVCLRVDILRDPCIVDQDSVQFTQYPCGSNRVLRPELDVRLDCARLHLRSASASLSNTSEMYVTVFGETARPLVQLAKTLYFSLPVQSTVLELGYEHVLVPATLADEHPNHKQLRRTNLYPSA